MEKGRKLSCLVTLFLLPVISCLHATLNVSNSQSRGVAITEDGSVLSCGSIVVNNTSRAIVAKCGFLGTINTNFGYEGYVATQIGSNPQANSILTQSDGKIVIAGVTQVGQQSCYLLARYDSNGILDADFNSTGTVTRFIGSNACAYQVALDSSNRYIMGGTSIINGAPIVTVVRYNNDGTPDVTFGNNGVAIKRIFGSASAHSLGIQSSGRIVTGGFTVNELGQRQFALIRFNDDGSVDPTFGFQGTLVTAIGNDSSINALAIKPNNYIIAAGVSNSQFTLAQYTANGFLDANFGANGIAIITVGTSAQINAVALQSDNKIVAVGFSDNAIAVIRCNSNGSLDTTFGNNGIITTPFTVTSIANAVGLETAGQIIVSGNCAQGSFVARYTSAGILDNSFGINGILNFPNTFDAPDIYNIADVNIANTAAIAYSKLNLSNSILNSDIASDAAIQDTKLAPLVTAGKVLNTATTATPTNVNGAIVARDTLGNCAVNTLSGNLVGNVSGAATENILKAGDTMSGSLVLPAGNPQVPSLQFSASENTGLSANGNILSFSTQGFERISVNENGSVIINAPSTGSALQIDGDTLAQGSLTVGENIVFNTAENSLNVVGTAQGPLTKVFTGTGNTGLQGSVTINYSAAGFNTIPIICFNPINGAVGTLSVNTITNTTAIITSVSALNIPFNYIAIGI